MLRAHTPQWSPIPPWSGCVLPISETKAVFDPNTAKPVHRKCAPAQKSKVPQNQWPARAPTQQKHGYSRHCFLAAIVRLQRPPANNRLRWATALQQRGWTDIGVGVNVVINVDQQNGLTIHLKTQHFAAPEVLYFGDLLKRHHFYPESTSNRSNAWNPACATVIVKSIVLSLYTTRIWSLAATRRLTAS
jgi:hypothetical protein